MSEANYAVGNATAEFQWVRNWTFGVRTLADSTIEVRNETWRLASNLQPFPRPTKRSLENKT